MTTPSSLSHLLQSLILSLYSLSFAQGDPDLNGDFRVMENSDGTVSFESVTCGGGFLGIPAGPKPITHISLNLVVSHIHINMCSTKTVRLMEIAF